MYRSADFGGDAPGMNAAIRAVTRTAIYNGYSVKGIMRGYKGLVDDEIIDLQSDSVSNIIQQGGTMLKTARSQEFMTPEGRRRAYENMKRSGIDALVVIGGDGSLKGAVFSLRSSMCRSSACRVRSITTWAVRRYDRLRYGAQYDRRGGGQTARYGFQP